MVRTWIVFIAAELIGNSFTLFFNFDLFSDLNLLIIFLLIPVTTVIYFLLNQDKIALFQNLNSIKFALIGIYGIFVGDIISFLILYLKSQGPTYGSGRINTDVFMTILLFIKSITVFIIAYIITYTLIKEKRDRQQNSDGA